MPRDLIEFLTFGPEPRTHDVGGNSVANQFCKNLFRSFSQNYFTLNYNVASKTTIRARGGFIYI